MFLFCLVFIVWNCPSGINKSLNLNLIQLHGLLFVVNTRFFELLTDYELEPSIEEDLLSLNEIQDAPTGLEWLLQELVSLRLALSQDDSESSAQTDWLALCLKLDCFLFRLYLFVLGLYASTLLLLWASWSFA